MERGLRNLPFDFPQGRPRRQGGATLCNRRRSRRMCDEAPSESCCVCSLDFGAMSVAGRQAHIDRCRNNDADVISLSSTEIVDDTDSQSDSSASSQSGIRSGKLTKSLEQRLHDRNKELSSPVPIESFHCWLCSMTISMEKGIVSRTDHLVQCSGLNRDILLSILPDPDHPYFFFEK
jgi:hypothetical protein